MERMSAIRDGKQPITLRRADYDAKKGAPPPAPAKPIYRLHLVDRGQNFTWLDVQGDTIIDAGPFQAHVWRGMKIKEPPFWQRGSRVRLSDGIKIAYAVVQVQKRKPGEAAPC